MDDIKRLSQIEFPENAIYINGMQPFEHVKGHIRCFRDRVHLTEEGIEHLLSFVIENARRNNFFEENAANYSSLPDIRFDARQN